MGLTGSSTGMNAACEAIRLEKHSENERIIALAGNPNVGKSTLFNELTGMRQHTGNWTGKTVCVAVGQHHFEGKDYKLVDLPGTYSLLASSAEEEAARDFICFSGADAVIVVCDATCLEKSLNLASQILEITKKAVICLNLTDEAAKKGIETDASALAEKLGAPVIPVCARIGKGLPELMREAEKICAGGENRGIKLPYPPEIKEAAERIEEKYRIQTIYRSVKIGFR